MSAEHSKRKGVEWPGTGSAWLLLHSAWQSGLGQPKFKNVEEQIQPTSVQGEEECMQGLFGEMRPQLRQPSAHRTSQPQSAASAAVRAPHSVSWAENP